MRDCVVLQPLADRFGLGEQVQIVRAARFRIRAGHVEAAEGVGSDDGAGALALSERQPIDILVCDIFMKEMDGWTLAAWLTQRLPELPVLFISGYPTNFGHGHRMNARWAFLPKPFQPGELVEAISNLVQVPI